ncbi:MAG: helix-turn-helix domain-containing protein [Oribacterium sp.]|nr:helix-turn-helix domain-containing protein [Oribacterium sp.]
MDSGMSKHEKTIGPFMEGDIIRAACKGCPNAQEQVLRHYSPLVRIMIRSIAHCSFHFYINSYDEDDLSQIVMIGVWEMLGSFQ